MKRSRLFLIAGGIILTISAVFATKAGKRFAGPSYQTVTVGFFPAGNLFLYGSKIFTTKSPSAGWVPVSLVIYTGTTYNSGVKEHSGQLQYPFDDFRVYVDHSTF